VVTVVVEADGSAMLVVVSLSWAHDASRRIVTTIAKRLIPTLPFSLKHGASPGEESRRTLIVSAFFR
jgi:hypothetical protein